MRFLPQIVKTILVKMIDFVSHIFVTENNVTEKSLLLIY